MNGIAVRNVTKSFGRQLVLNDVSLEIKPGETTAIVGPSGVGKSVLLKLIMGILKPDAGEVLVFGENISTARTEAERNRIRASVGVLFQSAALFDSLSVYDNVAFPLLERTRLSRAWIHRRVVTLMKELSLGRYSHNFPQEVSLGVRKRVGLARALIMEPKIILFDEPNTGLDPLVGQEVYDLINACRKRWGVSGVVISHEIPEVFQVSDRVAMLLGGRIVAQGSPDEVKRSEDPAVQQFLQGSTHGPIKIQ